MNIDCLEKHCTDPERASLSFLASAVEATQTAYETGHTSEQLVACQESQAAYEKKYAALVKKYKKKDEAKTIESWSDFEETKKISVVLFFLSALGYKVAERTLYRHAKNGTLRKNEAGYFTEKLTRKYVRTEGLVSSRDDVSFSDVVGGADKSRHDTEKSKWQALNEKQRYLRSVGKLGSRQEFNLQMAARLAVLDSKMRGFVDQYSAEIIAIVGGNQENRNDLSEFWLQRFNEAMRELSRPLDYRIIFKNYEK